MDVIQQLGEQCDEILNAMEGKQRRLLMAEAWLEENGVPRYVIDYLRNDRIKNPRDSQRRRVYKSEWEIRDNLHLIELEDESQVQTFIDLVTKTKWFKNRFGKRSISVVKTNPISTAAFAWVHTQEVAFPKGFRDELVILHEIAHCVQPPNTPSHGKEFSAILLDLVGRFIGEDFELALMHEFVKNRVDFNWTVSILSQPSKQLASV